MQITIFDTSTCSSNLGDFIIMDAVNKHLDLLFPSAMRLYSQTHEKISLPTYKMLHNSDYSFVGGTNLLSSNMPFYNQWKINLLDAVFLKDIILMGVGWWQYQGKPNLYTRSLLRSVLHKDILHSVRDSYTQSMLNSIGINNVINTSCMTMWQLTDEHCAEIPDVKAQSVVFTLTDYNKDIERDQQFIDLLQNAYQNVYFWPQGGGDFKYIKQLKTVESLHILPPRLSAFNEILLDKSKDIDYIGTRLHAGVRALQYNRRSIILGIDNRAVEKAKDFNINMLPRDDIAELDKLINSQMKTQIHIPQDNIEKWKAQFI